RFGAFFKGYDAVEGCRLSRAEIQVIPDLMIEALIGEAAAPVARTGAFDRFEGGAFLEMVDRKARWLESNRGRLAESLGV
ncbi:MAG: hypothetical protein VYC34_04390, partial [Planctomycetota bacterium]|nr:hypothetical protein [Planctomycetota bacterium]